MHTKALSRALLLATVAATFTVSAFAQWQWIDKDGRKVFSDRSPPAEVKDKDIQKRPAGAVRAGVVEPVVEADGAAKPAATSSAPLAKASAPRLSGKDKELEEKKKQAEAEAAAKKKADEDKLAQSKAESCERAKRNMATLQSGVRMASVNAKGEREIYDDSKRASETKRAQEVIDSSCK